MLAGNEEDLKYLLTKIKDCSQQYELHLNVKKTKILTNGPINNVTINGEEIEVVNDFILLGSTFNVKGSSNQKIKGRIALGKSAAKDLSKVFRSKDITLKTKVNLTHTMVFSIACESRTLKKDDRRRIDAFELWCWGRILKIPWTARRTNESVLEEIQPKCSLEAKMMRLRLSYFGHIVRKDLSLEKGIMFGKVEGQRKRRKPSIRWIDTIAAAMDANVRMVRQDRATFRSVTHRVAMSRKRLDGNELTN